MINEEWLKEALKMICGMIKSLEKNITETKSEQEKISSVLKSNPDILKEKDAELDNYIKEYVVKVDETKKNLYSLVENILNNFDKEMINKKEKLNSSLEKSKEVLNDTNRVIEMLSDKTTEINVLLKNINNIIETEATKVLNKKEKEFIEHFAKTINREINELIPYINKSQELSKTLTDDYQNITKKHKEILEDLSEKKKSIINEVVSSATEKIIEINPCKTVIINIDGYQKKFTSKDLFHEKFEKVLSLAYIKKPTLLKGPAGSGKNVIVEQVAKSLDLQLYYINDVTDEFKILGFMDANGHYQQTQFFKAFTEGGLMFIDEIDNSSPSALLAINSAIGTGYNNYMAFPDGNFYQAHPNFRLIAAANTFGTGADNIYCGRQALDGASLNRFLPVVIDYDKNIEEKLTNNSDLLPLFWNIREIINKNDIRHVISTRNIINAVDLLKSNAFNIYDIFDMTIIQGLDKFSLATVSRELKSNLRYSDEFLNYLDSKYEVSKNAYKESTEEDYSYKREYYGGF